MRRSETENFYFGPRTFPNGGWEIVDMGTALMRVVEARQGKGWELVNAQFEVGPFQTGTGVAVFRESEATLCEKCRAGLRPAEPEPAPKPKQRSKRRKS